MKDHLRKAGLSILSGLLTFSTFGLAVPQRALAFNGDGTAESPYLIETCADLYDIADDADTLAAHYKLNNDINCAVTAGLNPNESEWVDGVVDGELIPDSYVGVTNNGYSGFDPIGGPMDQFTGTFDGNGKTISNLWIFRKETSYVGLFGSTQGATIENLTLDNSSIVGSQYTGGVVGLATNTIMRNVTVNNSMARAYLSYYGGGVVGSMNYDDQLEHQSYISDVHVTGGTVHGSGNIIGGLVGNMYGGEIAASSSTADVDGGYSIGGAIGEMHGGTVSGVTVGEVTVHADFVENEIYPGFSKNGDRIGGLVGYMDAGRIEYSSSSANVEGEGNSVGGFVGDVAGWGEDPIVFNEVSASGTVTGLGNNSYNSRSVGGFAGGLHGNIDVSNATASGDVTNNTVAEADAAYSIGGFTGSSGCGVTYNNVLASGDVAAPDGTEVAGFIGEDGCEGPGSSLYNVRASGDVVGSVSVGGIVGSGAQTTISQSSATGDVTGVNYVGGLVGYMTGPSWTEASTSSIEQSYALGNVLAAGDGAGGLIGFTNGGLYSDSYARGNVTANRRIGGLIGEADGAVRIEHTYATGLLTATNEDPDPDFVGGLIGDTINVDTEVSVFYPSYFDQQTNGGVTADDDNESLETATPKNTNEMTTVSNTDTFTYDPNPSEDINGFDFENIWEYRSGQNADYPMLIWQSDPIGQVVCEQPHMTATSARMNCDVEYSGDAGRATSESWNATHIRKLGEIEWTGVEWTESTEGRRTFTGLDPDTEYQFKVHVQNNVIDQDVIVEGTTLPADADVDADSKSDVEENNAPNNGDANNDGSLDAEQDNVTSFVSESTGQYYVIQTACGLNTPSNTNVSSEPEPTEFGDVAFQYPAGLASFTFDCDDVAVVTQYVYGDFDNTTVVIRKYNPATHTYTTISDAVATKEVLGGEKVLKVVYQIADNGPLDQDPTVGSITDPVGIGVTAVSAPATGVR